MQKEESGKKGGQGKKKSDQKINQIRIQLEHPGNPSNMRRSRNGKKKQGKETLQDRPQNRKGIDTNTEQKRDICHAVNRNNNRSNRICFPGLRQRDAKSSSVVPRVCCDGRGTQPLDEEPSVEPRTHQYKRHKHSKGRETSGTNSRKLSIQTRNVTTHDPVGRPSELISSRFTIPWE